MTGVPVQPLCPYPQDPKAGPAPPQPGFMYPPSGPAPQYPLYPAGPPVYNPAGEWAPRPACSSLGILQPGSGFLCTLLGRPYPHLVSLAYSSSPVRATPALLPWSLRSQLRLCRPSGG